MPSISSRGIAMPESPIRKLVPFAEKAKKAGKTVYHLNIGQPDIETPKVALDAIRNFDEKVIEYSHSAGFASYREKLATYYNKVGIQLSIDDLLITTGGSESLLFGLMSCLNEGDEIIIPEPFYANYNGFAIAAGIKVVPITSTIESGFALPPITEFEQKITPKTKAILICNPGNPTGYLYSEKELETLAEIVKKHQLFLFADEVYREFCYDNKKHYSIMNLPGLEEHAVMVDSVSKRYSMCGARIGALVSRNKEVMAVALKFAQARLSPPTLAQVASEAALDTPASYFDEVNQEYVSRRNVLIEGLNAIPGVNCPTPGGAFYAVADLPIDDSDKFCQWLLESFDYNNETVMLAPASGFYANPEIGKTQVRIAYVLNQESLKRAIRCIKEALSIYPGSTSPTKTQEQLA
jgi:aspartate aminotransferase